MMFRAAILASFCILGQACGSPSQSLPDAGDPPSDAAVVDDAAADASAGCEADVDCSTTGQVCDTDAARCVDCRSARDCPGSFVCSGQMCVPPTACVSSVQCPGLTCNTATGVCAECVADVDCLESGTFCDSSSRCTPFACAPNGSRCVEAGGRETCDARGSTYVPNPCPVGQSCSGELAACMQQVCAPNAARCTVGSVTGREICAADGLSELHVECDAGESCNDGACLARICSPGAVNGCADVSSRSVCAADGLGYASAACAAMQGCVSGVCTAWSCEPGSSACVGSTSENVCAPDGQGYAAQSCGSTERCVEDSCRFACGSLGFDGSGDRLVGPALSAPSAAVAALTIETWVKIDTARGTSSHYIIDTRAVPGTGIFLNVDTDNIQFGFVTPSNWTFATSLVTPGVWHHVAGVWDGASRRVYVDGTLVETKTDAQGPYFATGPVVLGSAYDQSASIDGSIDAIRISTVARYTGATVAVPDFFENDASTHALWRFDEASGPTAVDSSANAFDVSFVGNVTRALACAFNP